METSHLADVNLRDLAAKSAQVLRTGGVVLYPTDTLYGLGADAFSDDAVLKIYSIKGRNENKPIHAIFADLKMAERYAMVDDAARLLAQEFLPGALTIILKKKSGFDTGIGRGMETIGVRIPADDFDLALAREFDAPYTTTSANSAGVSPGGAPAAILAQLGESASMIDLIIDAGEIPARAPSTVVDVSAGEPRILREGAIPSEDIMKILHHSFMQKRGE